MFAKLFGGLVLAAALAAPLWDGTLAAAPRAGDDGVGVRVERGRPCCRPGQECCKGNWQPCCRR